MALAQGADVVVYVCHHCTPGSARMPRQWEQEQLCVQVQQVPCSGKIEVQYLLHAFEGGTQGICVLACPQGECQRAQGNYRAEVRVRTVQRLLVEIGMEPERIALVHCSPQDPAASVENAVREATARFAALRGGRVSSAGAHA
jgi:F420-non-reducing hydrogenase iron-sulfur subunit